MGKELIYVEEDDRQAYENIELFKDSDWKDIFLFVMAWGFQKGIKEQINKKRDPIFRTSYFKPDDEILLNAVAIKETGSLDILNNPEQIYNIAEEYANAGIKLIEKKRKETAIGNFNTKIEKELIDIFNEFKNNKEEEGTLKYYLARGEGDKIEYKSTLIYDVKNKVKNKNLSKIVINTLAGFLNSKGGTLLIGVEDDSNIYGIENDMKILPKQNKDAFELHLMNLIKSYLGVQFAKYLKVMYKVKDSKTVCIIEVEASPKPVFVSFQDKEEFYVRSLNSTRLFNAKDTHEYIEMHWKD